MILDNLDNSAFYNSINEEMDKAFEFLKRTDLGALSPGRHKINGDKLYVSVQDTVSKPMREGFWEAHRKYIDIHVVIEGKERMGYAHIGELKAEPYDEEKDFMRLEGEGAGTFFTVLPGMFAVMMPQDAHMPGICVDKPERLRKVVVKVLVSQEIFPLNSL